MIKFLRTIKRTASSLPASASLEAVKNALVVLLQPFVKVYPDYFILDVSTKEPIFPLILSAERWYTPSKYTPDGTSLSDEMYTILSVIRSIVGVCDLPVYVRNSMARDLTQGFDSLQSQVLRTKLNSFRLQRPTKTKGNSEKRTREKESNRGMSSKKRS